jgi:hypothetical protein
VTVDSGMLEINQYLKEGLRFSHAHWDTGGQL